MTHRRGLETDFDTQKSDEAENNSFQTIAHEKDNPVNSEFEIGQLGNEELMEDECAMDESRHSTPGHNKPSQRNFNLHINEGLAECCPLADQKKKALFFATTNKRLPNDQN